MTVRVLNGNCVAVLAGLEADSFAACCTDPPYGLGFMSRDWDAPDNVAFRPETWAAVHRVLRPGAHLVAFGGTRTFHRLVCAIEDAGFEIRDTITWLYGSGFPKSHDVSKAIDRVAPRAGMFEAFAAHFSQQWQSSGMHRMDFVPHFPHYKNAESVMAQLSNWKLAKNVPSPRDFAILRGLIGLSGDWSALIERVEAEREVIGERQKLESWEYKGNRIYQTGGDAERVTIAETAPATEAARQWQGWGTALKPACELICLARKPLSEGTVAANVLRHGCGALNIDASRVATAAGDRQSYGLNGDEGPPTLGVYGDRQRVGYERDPAGRWPANCVHDGSPEVLEAFARFGERHPPVSNGSAEGGWFCGAAEQHQSYGDTGTAARFFFCGKAQSWEREGDHPTVKPVALMEWLVNLVTPPGGAVLDPFCGAGSTLVACDWLGIDATGIELSAETCADAERKIKRLRARRMLGDAPRVEPLPGQLSMLSAMSDGNV